jgi:5,10-methylenetetrahydrofolate reductase
VPSGLIKLIKQGFNAGLDLAGQAIGQPTTFYVGCALNLCAPDAGKEIKSLHKKIEAGADFALTQPIFESTRVNECLRRYAEAFGPLPIPVLAGVMPLAGARHASFFHNEVPGVFIPEPVRESLGRAGDGPEAAAEGMRLAQVLVTELQALGVVQGVYLMPPFSRYHVAAEIIDAVRARARS